ncbi:MAG: sodium-dependent transporter [Motiliproteus sp.]
MQENRGQFSSKLGFIMAAAGSAVGLGNIWGFPTQAASNGGGAFLLVYLILTFLLAYPVLMAELLIGRYARSNAVEALQQIAIGSKTRRFGFLVGSGGILAATFILSFYAIVAGWMIAFVVEPAAILMGAQSTAEWSVTFGNERNIVFTLIFMLLTIFIVNGGVKDGIEKWSSRLMPMLFVMLLALAGYVLTLDGAMEGLQVYLVPDFSQIFNPELIISALGQAFFSMSLGVGTMLIYGSYVGKQENLPKLGAYVTLVDTGIAFIAGLLILPTMYVAKANGVEIFSESGTLLNSDTLIFNVLPAFFDTMGESGLLVSIVFFILMTIAALTSSISMLEVPVAYAVEHGNLARKKAGYLIGGLIFVISLVIIFNFGALFGLVITITTQYAQPIIGLMFCLFIGWIWHRNSILQEIKHGYPQAEHSFFWKVWPNYVKFVCPLLIVLLVAQSLG